MKRLMNCILSASMVLAACAGYVLTPSRAVSTEASEEAVVEQDCLVVVSEVRVGSGWLSIVRFRPKTIGHDRWIAVSTTGTGGTSVCQIQSP